MSQFEMPQENHKKEAPKLPIPGVAIDTTFEIDTERLAVDPEKRDRWIEVGLNQIKEREEESQKWKVEGERRQQQTRYSLQANKDATIESLKDLSEGYSDYNRVDSLIESALGVNEDGRLTPLIEAAVDAYIAQSDYNFQGWSHAVCHNFERCSIKTNEQNSLLDFPELHGASRRLFDDAVRRAIHSRNDGCMSRVMGGVITYNLREASVDRLDEPFAWKPDSLKNEEFVKDYLGEGKQAFARANTPREFIEELCAVVARGEDEYPRLIPMELLMAVRNEENAHNIDAYIAHMAESYACEGVPPGEIPENIEISRRTGETLKGVFVDVEGTLLKPRSWRSEIMVLSELANAINYMSPVGAKVTVFSGGDTEELTQKLSELGFPQRFLPVQPKSEYKGKNLEILIDDGSPELQGFSSETYLKPSVDELMKLDPFGVVAAFRKRKEAQRMAEEQLEKHGNVQKEGGAEAGGASPPSGRVLSEAELQSERRPSAWQRFSRYLSRFFGGE